MSLGNCPECGEEVLTAVSRNGLAAAGTVDHGAMRHDDWPLEKQRESFNGGGEIVACGVSIR